MTLQKTIENDLQNTIENDLDFGVPKPLKTIKNAKTPKTSILPPLVEIAHRILKEICVCLRRFICFFSPKPYIYIYIYRISQIPMIPDTPKCKRRPKSSFLGSKMASEAKIAFFHVFYGFLYRERLKMTILAFSGPVKKVKNGKKRVFGPIQWTVMGFWTLKIDKKRHFGPRKPKKPSAVASHHFGGFCKNGLF